MSKIEKYWAWLWRPSQGRYFLVSQPMDKKEATLAWKGITENGTKFVEVNRNEMHYLILPDGEKPVLEYSKKKQEEEESKSPEVGDVLDHTVLVWIPDTQSYRFACGFTSKVKAEEFWARKTENGTINVFPLDRTKKFYIMYSQRKQKHLQELWDEQREHVRKLQEDTPEDPKPTPRKEKACDCQEFPRGNDEIRLMLKHHPHCHKYDVEGECRGLLLQLIEGIEVWAREEDGVHDDCWDVYEEACGVVGMWNRPMKKKD